MLFHSILLFSAFSFLCVDSYFKTVPGRDVFLPYPVDAYNASGLVKLNVTGRQSTATIYRIVNGPRWLRIWQPHRDDNVNILCEASSFWLVNHPEWSIEITYSGGFNGAALWPICYGCVDVLILGNAHVMHRQGNGEILDLTQYLQVYQSESGDIITNDLGRFCYLEGSYAGRWYALPLMSSTLLLYFNRTVYDLLNMTYPPPFGNWPQGTWTWKAMVNQVQQIRAVQGLDKGWYFPASCSNIAEWTLVSMVAQSYNTEVLDGGDGSSNLNRDSPEGGRLRKAFEEIIIPLFLAGGTNPLQDWVIPSNTSDPNYASAIAQLNWWLENGDAVHPETNNTLGCAVNTFLETYLSGLAVQAANKWTSVSTALRGPLWVSPNTPNYTVGGKSVPRNVGLGIMPGTTSYLGGSYIAIPTNSTAPDVAWDFITNLVNRSNPYLYLYSGNQGTPPPYESAWKFNPMWDSPDNVTFFDTYSKAVPPTYPLASFPAWPQFEARYFMRYFLIDQVYKRLTFEEASERTNALIADVFLPQCMITNNIQLSLSDCRPDMTREVDFSLENTSCKGAVTLPEPQHIRCEYIPSVSGTGKALIALSALGLVLAISGAVFLLLFRMKPPVRASFWPFGIIFSLGCALCFSSVIVSVGPSTPANQTLQPIFLCLGFACIFGTFVMKLYRLDRIFSADIGQIGKNRITDGHMFFGLACILFAELVVLGIFYYLGPPEIVEYEQDVIAGSETLSATASGWKVGENIGTAIVLIFNFVLLLLALIASIRLRNIPSNFKESQLNLVAATVISLDVLIICPLAALQIDHVNSIVILGFGVLFATFAIWATYFIPKIVFVLKDVQVFTQEQTDATQHDVASHRKNLEILKSHLGPLFLACATSAQKSPELLLDEVMAQLRLPCEEADLSNVETRTDLLALWCLPAPLTTLISAMPSKASSARSKSGGGSLGSKPKAESKVESKAESKLESGESKADPLAESRVGLVETSQVEMSSGHLGAIDSPRETQAIEGTPSNEAGPIREISDMSNSHAGS